MSPWRTWPLFKNEKKKNLFVIIYREKNQFLFDLQNAVRILDVNLTLYVTKYDWYSRFHWHCDVDDNAKEIHV